MSQKKLILVGKIPPPFMGTAVWFDVLRKSSLNNSFQIQWFNVNVHRDFSTLGSKNILKIWPNLHLYIQFRKLVDDFRPDLILIPVSQSTIGFLKDSIYIKLAGKKPEILIVLHGSNLLNWLKKSSWITRVYFSRIMKSPDGVIVLGEKLKYLFKKWFREDQIYVVPNGLNLSFGSFEKTSTDIILIRFIGSLIRSKGILELIQAIGLLKEKYKNIILIINGTWRDKVLKHQIEQLISSQLLPVRYEGEVTGSEKESAYKNSDIFVFTPNKPEGHPYVIIEAMAAGLPIISTDQGAITESVIDGLNGFIVKPNCPEEIAEKLKYLIEHPQERIKMGRESRRLYEENFTEEKMVARLTEVFNKVLAQN